MLPLASLARETRQISELCLLIGERAGEVMFARQAGTPLKQAITENARRQPHLGKVGSDMMMMAYAAPIETSDEARTKRVKEFVSHYIVWCETQQDIIKGYQAAEKGQAQP
jgi:hypothetical protein